MGLYYVKDDFYTGNLLMILQTPNRSEESI